MNFTFYDRNGELNYDLIDRDSQELAKKFVPKNERGYPEKWALKSNQLRNFYGEFRGIYYAFMQSNDFKKVTIRLKMLKSKAMYAAPKSGTTKIPREFRDFLIRLVEETENTENIHFAMKFFESVVGYCYGEGISDK